MSLIDQASVAALGDRFPRAPGRLRHHLADEPLLQYAALAEAARALPPAMIERRVHNAADGAAFRLIEDGGPADADIAAGGADDAWIMLRDIERIPAYLALMERLLADLAPLIGRTAGPPLGIKGFVFVSPPGTHTPFHFDAEYNILFQIRGDKTFAAYPPSPPFLDLAQRELYHRAGENLLAFPQEHAAAGEEHLLGPGEALFVPYAAPHWVTAGQSPSISLSVTWQTRRTRAVADAVGLNPLLRRVGLPAYDPAVRNHAPWVRAGLSRVGQRIGLL